MLKITEHTLFSSNAVRELQISRPPVNALNFELLESLKEAIVVAPKDGVGALVLSGAGGVFSAGMDIKETATLSEIELTRTFQALKDVTLAIGYSSIPIAAAVTGNCLGAGAVFSLFCDYRVMSKDRVSFGITEVKGGMKISPHIIYALERIVGGHQAQNLILGAKLLDAQGAYQLGLADELVSRQLAVSRAVAWCDRMLKLPPGAMAGTREAARAKMTEILTVMEAEPIEIRVNEWFDEDVQSSLQRLLKV